MAKTETVKIEDLTLDPENARRRDAKAKGAIKASLEQFGAGRSVVVDGDGVIRAGNGTVTEARDLGFNSVVVVEPGPGELVAVKRGDWTEEQARAYGVADNRTTDLSRFDDQAAAKILASVPGIPPEAMGYSKRELVSFLAKVAGRKKESDPAPRVILSDSEIASRLILKQGDCLDVMRELGDGLADALVTDPPAGIAFMGKSWDSDKGGRDKWIEWLGSVLAEARRVLKPGAHGLIWSIPRTSHWTGAAIEAAGFEIRDCVAHLFGTGFPKSLDIGKEIEAARYFQRPLIPGTDQHESAEDAASHWGWGTGLKPAIELWWLVRAPFEGTVAANVETNGTGGINIDDCRIGIEGGTREQPVGGDNPGDVLGVYGKCKTTDAGVGRWPANVAISHMVDCTDDGCAPDCPVAELDRQSGDRHSYCSNPETAERASGRQFTNHERNAFGFKTGGEFTRGRMYADGGGASRFFYCPKPSNAERDLGLDGRPKVKVHELSGRKEGSAGSKHGRAGQTADRRNIHPTVKPIEFMRWLVRLVTPPGGLVLDPFMGSGTTGIAALVEGAKFLGIEREAEYFEVARERILAGATREIEGDGENGK